MHNTLFNRITVLTVSVRIVSLKVKAVQDPTKGRAQRPTAAETGDR